MKDEIKEILDGLNVVIKQEGSLELNFKECKKILDCITNLEESDKEWSMIFDTFSKRPYAHKYLQQKKKELGNKNIIGLDSEMIYKDYYELKSRNEKAIEHIEESLCILKGDSDISILTGNVRNRYLKPVLNILKGSDKDECKRNV